MFFSSPQRYSCKRTSKRISFPVQSFSFSCHRKFSMWPHMSAVEVGFLWNRKIIPLVWAGVGSVFSLYFDTKHTHAPIRVTRHIFSRHILSLAPPFHSIRFNATLGPIQSHLNPFFPGSTKPLTKKKTRLANSQTRIGIAAQPAKPTNKKKRPSVMLEDWRHSAQTNK